MISILGKLLIMESSSPEYPKFVSSKTLETDNKDSQRFWYDGEG